MKTISEDDFAHFYNSLTEYYYSQIHPNWTKKADSVYLYGIDLEFQNQIRNCSTIKRFVNANH